MSPTDIRFQSEPALSRVRRRKYVGGAGGSRAILANAGQLFACMYYADMEFDLMGGASGGSVTTAVLSGLLETTEKEKALRQMLRLVVDLDFSKYVPRHATPLMTVASFLLRDRFVYTRPAKGVLNSEPLGALMDSMVPVWPRRYWALAVIKDSQVLFTRDGVWQHWKDGRCEQLSDKPVPVGLAVRASCSIPGVIDAVEWNGHHLFDGALSWDGACPVGIMARHYGTGSDEIVACDVGDEKNLWTNITRKFWTLVAGSHSVDKHSVIPDGTMLMRPDVWSVRSLQFRLTSHMKWQAVHSGFQEAVIELRRHGFLSGEKLYEALAVCNDIEKLKSMAL